MAKSAHPQLTPITDNLVRQALKKWHEHTHVESVIVGLFLAATTLAIQWDLIQRSNEFPELAMGPSPNVAMAIASMVFGLLLLNPDSRRFAYFVRVFSSTAAKTTATLLGVGIAYFAASFVYCHQEGIEIRSGLSVMVIFTMIAFAFFHLLYSFIAWGAKMIEDHPEMYEECFGHTFSRLKPLQLPLAMIMITLMPVLLYLELHP